MNNTIFLFFYSLAHKSNIFDNIVIFSAVYFPYIVVVSAILFLLFHHEIFDAVNPYKAFLQKKKEIIMVFFSGALAWTATYVLKHLFALSRPFDVWNSVKPLFSETGYTFPSGHATFYMALAVAVFFLNKKVGSLFIIFAFIIGVARIIGGVHFPFDIIGGFALGTLVSFICRSLYSSSYR